MQIVKVTRSQICLAGYGTLLDWRGERFLAMGNTVHVQNGVRCIWAAAMATGKREDIPVSEVKAYIGKQPTLLQVVHQVEAWAKSGNGDAMWWLGDFYEFGSKETGANGGKALAYYLGAIRCDPRCYDADTVGRVLEDGSRLFVAHHPDDVEDRTPSDRLAFLKKFREFREIETHGHVFYPDVWDWEECVAIAESLS